MPRIFLALLIGLLSFFAAWFYNTENIKALRADAPKRLDANNTVRTPDDNAYLAPPINFFEGREWKENNPGKQSYFLRSPGYGGFRLVLMKVLGFENSFALIFKIQLLFFAVASALLFYIGLFLGLRLKPSLALGFIYGFSPFACGFLNYNITESITPQLVIILLFLLFIKGNNNKILAGIIVVMALLLLTRPVLGFLLLPFSVLLFQSFKKNRFFLTALSIISACAPLVCWEIRNTIIAGKYPGLQPIYFEENNSPYRSSHCELWNFEKLFGKDVASFHQEVGTVWKTANTDSTFVSADAMLAACPYWVRAGLGDSALQQAFRGYEISVGTQQALFPRQCAMPDTIPHFEAAIAENFKVLRSDLNRKCWVRCNLIVPFINLKKIAGHSNLSLYVFQHPLRGKYWMEFLRGFFVLLHICCLISVFVLAAAGLPDPAIRLRPVAITTALYLLYLAFIFRALEERYTLPFLAVGLLCTAVMASSFYRRLKS